MSSMSLKKFERFIINAEPGSWRLYPESKGNWRVDEKWGEVEIRKISLFNESNLDVSMVRIHYFGLRLDNKELAGLEQLDQALPISKATIQARYKSTAIFHERCMVFDRYTVPRLIPRFEKPEVISKLTAAMCQAFSGEADLVKAFQMCGMVADKEDSEIIVDEQYNHAYGQ